MAVMKSQSLSVWPVESVSVSVVSIGPTTAADLLP